MTYDTPASWRQAVEARLVNRARATGVDLDRIRRRLVVGRLLARLEAHQPGRWILKGGMALELRIGDRARATRDVDVVVRDADQSGEEVRANLSECLATDPDGDRIDFIVGSSQELEPDEAGRPGWRFPIEVRMAGREFARHTHRRRGEGGGSHGDRASHDRLGAQLRWNPARRGRGSRSTHSTSPRSCTLSHETTEIG